MTPSQSFTVKHAAFYPYVRDEWPAMQRRLISDQTSLILRRGNNLDRPLSEYGLESLGTLN